MSKQQFYVPLSECAMREVGPAAQTLGGLYTLTSGNTFRRVSDIAEASCVPVSTCRKHLAKLTDTAWIDHCGREPSDSGLKRRTVTYSLTRKARQRKEPFVQLPTWTGQLTTLTWAEKALLAVVMSRYEMLEATKKYDKLDVGGACYKRFQFPLRQLEIRTGMDRKSLIAAKRKLSRGLIELDGSSQNLPDVLFPRYRVSEL